MAYYKNERKKKEKKFFQIKFVISTSNSCPPFWWLKTCHSFIIVTKM